MGHFLGKLLSTISWGTKDYGILMVGLDNAGEESFFLSLVNTLRNTCITTTSFCTTYESNHSNAKSSAGNLRGLWA